MGSSAVIQKLLLVFIVYIVLSSSKKDVYCPIMGVQRSRSHVLHHFWIRSSLEDNKLQFQAFSYQETLLTEYHRYDTSSTS